MNGPNAFYKRRTSGCDMVIRFTTRPGQRGCKWSMMNTSAWGGIVGRNASETKSKACICSCWLMAGWSVHSADRHPVKEVNILDQKLRIYSAAFIYAGSGWMADRMAKATLVGALIFSSLTIWAVHFQQQQEREVKRWTISVYTYSKCLWFQTMYKGVLKDDERRREKIRQREEDLHLSQQKRELYERVQTVNKSSASWGYCWSRVIMWAIGNRLFMLLKKLTTVLQAINSQMYRYTLNLAIVMPLYLDHLGNELFELFSKFFDNGRAQWPVANQT